MLFETKSITFKRVRKYSFFWLKKFDNKWIWVYNTCIEFETQEKQMTKPYYAMYTDFGNDAIEAIVRTAKVLKLDWPQVLDELRILAQRFPEDFGEAMDTVVREMVYDKLGFTSDFYV